MVLMSSVTIYILAAYQHIRTVIGFKTFLCVFLLHILTPITHKIQIYKNTNFKHLCAISLFLLPPPSPHLSRWTVSVYLTHLRGRRQLNHHARRRLAETLQPIRAQQVPVNHLSIKSPHPLAPPPPVLTRLLWPPHHRKRLDQEDHTHPC